MISAWKRFVSRNDGSHQVQNYSGQMPNGIQKLDRNLQKKFARGVQYNMKIVIKGDQRVGKTCLFNRLKGEQFSEVYNPTDEIQATTIHWNYKATDDIVKIDVWEAIDLVKRKRRQTPDLKLENNNNDNMPAASNGSLEETNSSETTTENNHPPDEQALDASLIDAYKDANAVLLVMDMTKSWTFKYIQNEIPKIPKHLPILIINNHRDMGHHRSITQDQVRTYIQTLDRSSLSDGHILYSEASMKNGFGLRFIHKFFNIPFLRLQEVTLLKQLELNRIDLSATQEELVAMNELEDQEYEQFLEMITIRRRQQADMLSPASGAISANKSAALAAGKPVPPTATTTNPIKLDSFGNGNMCERPENNPNQLVFNRSPSIIIGANRPLPDKSILKSKTTKPTYPEQLNDSTHEQSKFQNGQPFHTSNNIHESGAMFSKNNETNENDTNEADENDNASDDSDDFTTANPLVANYQDELDPDDLCEGVETGHHMAVIQDKDQAVNSKNAER